MSTLQGFAGLAQMADQAQQAPVNLATSKANLEAIQQGIAQRKLTDPYNLATLQKNLDILNQSYKQNEIIHPLQVQQYKDAAQQAQLNIADLQRQAEEKQKAQKALDDAILENQTAPSGEKAQKLNIAAAARNPQQYAMMQSAINNADDRTRRNVFDTNFDTWAALASGSPDDARAVLEKSIEAANNGDRKDLAAKYALDLKMLDTDPSGNSLLNKTAMVAANSPQHKAAMDMYAKGITLPPSVARDVKKESDQAEAANNLTAELSDLQNKWMKMPEKLGAVGYAGAKVAEGLPFLRSEEDNIRLLTDSYFNLDRLKIFKKEMGSMGIRNQKEFETALGGKVSVYSDKSQVLDRLEAIKSLLSKEAATKEANANWISTFKGSTIATKPGMITGIPIEKGMTVKDFQKQYAQKLFPENSNMLDSPIGNVDEQGNPITPPAKNTSVTATMPDGRTGTIPRDQIDAFKKKYPGSKFQ
jgi:hypothetical protein